MRMIRGETAASRVSLYLVGVNRCLGGRNGAGVSLLHFSREGLRYGQAIALT